MGKDEAEANSRESEGSPEKQAARKDSESRGGGQQLAASDARKAGSEVSTRPTEASAQPAFRSHRELGTAILAAGDPVKAGCELLDKETSEDRGAATRLKSLQTFADWAFEKPGADGYRKPPRIIWDIPGPPYEPVEPEELEGGEK